MERGGLVRYQHEVFERIARFTSGEEEAVPVPFIAGGMRFALPPETVAAVLPTSRPISRVPSANDILVGVTAVGNDIVPVLDVSAAMHHGKTRIGPKTWIVALTQSSGAVGILVEGTLATLHTVLLDDYTMDPPERRLPFVSGQITADSHEWRYVDAKALAAFLVERASVEKRD